MSLRYYPRRKWEKADGIGKLISDNAVILCSTFIFQRKIIICICYPLVKSLSTGREGRVMEFKAYILTFVI